MSNGVLSGVRVVELGGGHAAAVAALLLAEAGADVVKVEGREGAGRSDAASFAVWNRGKRSVLVDADGASGAADLQRLIRHADIVVTDWLPSVQRARGVNAAALRQRLPQLVHVAIGGWPAGHPLEERPVDDTLVLAEAGLMDEQRGYRDGPIYLRFPLGSWGAAYLAAIGAIARLIRRGHDGAGGTVTTSVLQGALVPTAMLWRRAERPTDAFLNSMGKEMRSPQFECADGVWLHLKAPPDAAPLMREALAALGPERIAELNRGHPSDHSCVNWGANAHIFRTRPSREWLDDLWAADIPVQADVSLGQIYFDEQAEANGYVVAVEDPVLGSTRQPGPPVTIDPPMRPRGGAPLLGSDAVTVWDEMAKPATGAAPPAAGLPLAGIRVADFGAYLAGPLAAMLLADLGADVVKVEGPKGDVMRRVPGAFIGCQRGKRSLALDLKGEGARDVVAGLARWADIVHHNIRLPAATRLGLDYPSLAAIDPHLIFCHVSSYGPAGPRKDWPGYDQLFQAQTGWEYEGAGAGKQPMWHRFGMMDHQAAMASVLGTLLALYHRDRTGKGQAVAASLLGASLMTVSETVVAPDGRLTPFRRLDAAQTGLGPERRLYRVADGWVAVVAEAPGSLEALCARVAAAEPADLERAFAGMSIAAAIAAVRASGGVAVEARTDNRDAFFDDAANRASGMVQRYDHAEFGRLEMVGAFMTFGADAAISRRPPPATGEHSIGVLHDLGWNDARIGAMLDEGLVLQAQDARTERQPGIAGAGSASLDNRV